MDLDDSIAGALCRRDCKVYEGTYEDLEDASFLVIAFGRSRRPGETRLDMFDDSIRSAREVIGHLRKVNFRGIMISISNPADIICEYIRRKMDWDPHRCFCTGTSLETFRMMRVLHEVTGVSRHSIQGFCMGEHGNSSFPVWSHVSIQGVPFLELRKKRSSLRKISLDELQTRIRRAGDVEIDGKGCTEFGIANVAGMLISAIQHDQKLVWQMSPAVFPASSAGKASKRCSRYSCCRKSRKSSTSPAISCGASWNGPTTSSNAGADTTPRHRRTALAIRGRGRDEATQRQRF